MSLRHIADKRFDEWETAVRRFIHGCEIHHDLGLVEIGKAQLLKGLSLKHDLDDPDVEDRERMMLIEELGAKTAQYLDRAIHDPRNRGVATW